MPNKKLLVVVDMQNDFISGPLGSNEAQRIVIAAASYITAFDGDVAVTLDTHGPDYLRTAEGRALPVPHCAKGSDGWRLDAAIEGALAGKEALIFEKPTFGSKALADYIAQNYEDIYIIGVCTDICVISNALLIKAYAPQAQVHVVAACTAATSENAQRSALLILRSCQIDVI